MLNLPRFYTLMTEAGWITGGRSSSFHTMDAIARGRIARGDLAMPVCIVEAEDGPKGPIVHFIHAVLTEGSRLGEIDTRVYFPSDPAPPVFGGDGFLCYPTPTRGKRRVVR